MTWAERTLYATAFVAVVLALVLWIVERAED